MAHPNWVVLVQSGTCVNVAPTVLPVGTWRLPPGTIATTRRRSTEGSWSSWVAMRWMRMADPWESPIRMMGRPSSWAKKSRHPDSRLS